MYFKAATSLTPQFCGNDAVKNVSPSGLKFQKDRNEQGVKKFGKVGIKKA